MVDSKASISSLRLNELLTAISDARQALQNWQDQRTGAMIQLDSFAYDLQKMDEDRARLELIIEESKKEADAQAKVYQAQILELTDQVQLQKYEVEGLKQALLQKDLMIEAQRKELEGQARLKDQLVQSHNKRLSEIEIESEKRHAATLVAEKAIQQGISAELLEMSKRRSDAETKIESLEREINHIRSQMIGLLNPNMFGKSGEVSGSAASASEFTEMHTIQSTARSGAATVDDYLKKLGY